VTAAPSATQAPGAAARPRRPAWWRRSRRWLRLAVPLAVAVLILAGTVVAHAMQGADPRDLRPDNTGPHGGATLAGMLRSGGVTVREMTRSPDALRAALSGNTTLFVPAPDLMHPDYLRLLDQLPPTTRVVLVAPSGYTLQNGYLPVRPVGSRWATRPASPGCELPEARRAGRASVYHDSYRPTQQTAVRCYEDALVGIHLGAAEVLLVGAGEPFRNDRIGEQHNAALATGLLSGYPTVVWLDLPRSEPGPSITAPPVVGQPLGQPSGSEVPGDPGFTGGGNGGAGNGNGGGGAGGNGTGGGNGNAGGTGDGASDSKPPLPVPPQFWAVLAMLAAAAVALALARARRLGPPVTEPLPVLVRGVETVTGRGRLYRRARARSAALTTLRTAALHRLLPLLDLDGDPPAPSTVVDALAARTGRPADEVRETLYGPEPLSDKDLVAATRALDALMHDAFTDVHKGDSR
jgi:uncharacterized membrane protein YgcG